jgi:hypothetical protein
LEDKCSKGKYFYFQALFNDCISNQQIMWLQMRRKYEVMTNENCVEMAENQD